MSHREIDNVIFLTVLVVGFSMWTIWLAMRASWRVLLLGIATGFAVAIFLATHVRFT